MLIQLTSEQLADGVFPSLLISAFVFALVAFAYGRERARLAKLRAA